jgi:hypothetical protein
MHCLTSIRYNKLFSLSTIFQQNKLECMVQVTGWDFCVCVIFKGKFKVTYLYKHIELIANGRCLASPANARQAKEPLLGKTL